MSAPVGNQFWKLRSKHGRDKLFGSPELMWEAACEYFNWCDAHPWWKNEAIKSGFEAGKIIKIPIARPYTLTGFLLYIRAAESYWRQFRSDEHKDFLTVMEEIEKTIYTNKFEGAAVGAFNANLIARDLGLKDKSEVTGENGAPLNPIIKIGYGPRDKDD